MHKLSVHSPKKASTLWKTAKPGGRKNTMLAPWLSQQHHMWLMWCALASSALTCTTVKVHGRERVTRQKPGDLIRSGSTSSTADRLNIKLFYGSTHRHFCTFQVHWSQIIFIVWFWQVASCSPGMVVQHFRDAYKLLSRSNDSNCCNHHEATAADCVSNLCSDPPR